MVNIWFIATVLIMVLVLFSGSVLSWVYLTESETRTVVLNPSDRDHEIKPTTLVLTFHAPNGFRVGNEVVVENVTPVGPNSENYLTEYFGILTVLHGDAGTGDNFIDLRKVHEQNTDETFELTSSTSVSAYLVDLDAREHDGIYQLNDIQTSQHWIIPFLGIFVALCALVFTIPSGMHALREIFMGG